MTIQQHIEQRLAEGIESGALKPETTLDPDKAPPLMKKIHKIFPDDRMLGWNKQMDCVFVYSQSKWFGLDESGDVIEEKA